MHNYQMKPVTSSSRWNSDMSKAVRLASWHPIRTKLKHCTLLTTLLQFARSSGCKCYEGQVNGTQDDISTVPKSFQATRTQLLPGPPGSQPFMARRSEPVFCLRMSPEAKRSRRLRVFVLARQARTPGSKLSCKVHHKL